MSGSLGENSLNDDDKRLHERHDYREQVYFDFIYDFQAKVDFNSFDEENESGNSEQYSGITHNVSTQGLCFSTDAEVSSHSILDIYVHLMNKDETVKLQGEVRWNKVTSVDQNGNKRFDVGIHLTQINGRSVQETIHYDENYHIYWSEVLESLLGNFRKRYQL